jgi:acetolactate synthase I/II/III large subunit
MSEQARSVPRADGNTKRTVAQAIAAALRRHKVPFTFGQSLPSAVHLANADIGIRQIVYRTENAGAYMADGYARVARQVPVVTAQNGPAATLLVPGLAEAMKASVPMVAIVQDVPRPAVDRNAFQELDHFDLFRSCAKWVRRLSDPARVDDYIDMAFTAAASGRMGPAVLLVPLDLQVEDAAISEARRESLSAFPLDRCLADPAAIARTADLLMQAERPLIVAGGGIHLSGAHEILAELQEKFALPVATTVMGKGAVAETHALSVGVVGYAMGRGSATRYLRPLVESSDVILLIGTRTNQNGTDSWKLFPPSARFIHLDVDPQEIGRNYEALRLLGDARLTLEVLASELAKRDMSKRLGRRATLAATIADARRKYLDESQASSRSDGTPARPERLVSEMQAVLSESTIVVADASYASVWIANGLRALAPGMRFLTPRGMAGLGWGFPMALGAKLASPGSSVICLVGDGGFAHVWSELETARRMGLHVSVTVLNNQVLAYQKDAEDTRFGRHTDACQLGPVDHAKIAEACGCAGVRIEQPSDYADALRSSLAASRTTVIDVVTDPMAYPPISAFESGLAAVRRSRGQPEA